MYPCDGYLGMKPHLEDQILTSITHHDPPSFISRPSVNLFLEPFQERDEGWNTVGGSILYRRS